MNYSLEKAKSLHIFMFPFMWKGSNHQDEGDIIHIIKDTGRWEEEGLDRSNLKEYSKLSWEEKLKDPRVWNYNQRKYFYGNVHRAINNIQGDNWVVSNWHYKLKGNENIYEIKIKNKDNHYKLNIDNIILKLYNSGIGILSFHLINDKYIQEEDILCINDYGRRIFPPFFPLEDSQDKVLAESITLNINDSERCFKENFDFDYLNEDFKISSTIMSLLGDKFTTDIYASKDKILIKPVIDDRMFVVCWWGNKERSEFLKKYHSMCDGDFWHEFFFVDNEESGCQSDVMLKDLLKKHTYERWLKYGSIYGITRYSFMLLTSDYENTPEFLLVHMWTIYYQMACLVLAQRASILKFSEEISAISEESKIDNERVQQLHLDYIRFINQLYFREVTAQEQGIEMYDMLVKSMSIERDIKRLDEEIGELHQHIRMEKEEEINSILHVLTIIGALFVFPSLITGFFGMNIFPGDITKLSDIININCWGGICLAIPLILSAVLVFFKKFTKCVHYVLVGIVVIYVLFLLFLYIKGGMICG